MLTNDQALRLNRFANGGDFDTDEEFFEALKEIDSSEELHYLAQILNWDDYRTPQAIEQVLGHPKCDAGTALQIYWMNEPEGLKDMELKNGVVALGARDCLRSKKGALPARFAGTRVGGGKGHSA